MIRRRFAASGVVTFFVVTYAVMWASYISVAAAAIPARSPLGAVLVHLGAFAPSLVALWLTARAEGGTGLRTLLLRSAPCRWSGRSTEHMETDGISEPRTGLAFAPKCASRSAVGKRPQAFAVELAWPSAAVGHPSATSPVAGTVMRIEVRIACPPCR